MCYSMVNQTTNLERRTNKFKELNNCKVIGVNKDSKAIRVTVLEDDTETRETIEEMATNFFSDVTEVERENGSLLLEIAEDIEEELPF